MLVVPFGTISMAKEKQHGRTVLFPIRVDDAVKDTTEQWAYDIRRTRYTGNFTRWKEHDAYQEALWHYDRSFPSSSTCSSVGSATGTRNTV